MPPLRLPEGKQNRGDQHGGGRFNEHHCAESDTDGECAQKDTVVPWRVECEPQRQKEEKDDQRLQKCEPVQAEDVGVDQYEQDRQNGGKAAGGFAQQ